MKTAAMMIAMLLVLPHRVAANDRNLIALSATSGATLGAIGGFWGTIGLDKKFRRDTDGWDAMLISGPVGFIGGCYLGASIARANLDSRNVNVNKVVLGNALGVIVATPVMLLLDAKAEKSTFWEGVIVATLIGGALVGSRIGANNLSFTTPAIRF